MTEISKNLERKLRRVIENSPILPIKVEDGILVGTVKIVSNGALKDLWRNDTLIYKEVSLNKVAIKLANMVAKQGITAQSENIYRADQEYGKWFVESRMLRAQYQKAVNNQDYERSDMFWARYCESRDRTAISKNRAESLAAI